MEVPQAETSSNLRELPLFLRPMARQRTLPEQAETVRLFVVWLYDQSGAPNFTEYARRVGLSTGDYSKWRSPTQVGLPDVHNLLRMLENSPALTDEAKDALARARESATLADAPTEGLPRVPRRKGP